MVYVSIVTSRGYHRSRICHVRRPHLCAGTGIAWGSSNKRDEKQPPLQADDRFGASFQHDHGNGLDDLNQTKDQPTWKLGELT